MLACSLSYEAARKPGRPLPSHAQASQPRNYYGLQRLRPQAGTKGIPGPPWSLQALPAQGRPREGPSKAQQDVEGPRRQDRDPEIRPQALGGFPQHSCTARQDTAEPGGASGCRRCHRMAFLAQVGCRGDGAVWQALAGTQDQSGCGQVGRDSLNSPTPGRRSQPADTLLGKPSE